MSNKARLHIVLCFASVLFIIWVYSKVFEHRIIVTKSDMIRIYNCVDRAKLKTEKQNDWRVLTASELRSVFQQKGCKFNATDRVPVDPWGGMIWVAMRTVANGGNEFVVCSNGADGRFSTSDDIVSSKQNPWPITEAAPDVLRD
jgi:hypothetical protein